MYVQVCIPVHVQYVYTHVYMCSRYIYMLIRATIQDYGTLSPNIPGDSSDPKSSSATDREDARADMVTKLKLREKKHSFTTSWGPVGFKKSRHPLSIMVCTCKYVLICPNQYIYIVQYTLVPLIPNPPLINIAHVHVYYVSWV